MVLGAAGLPARLLLVRIFNLFSYPLLEVPLVAQNIWDLLCRLLVVSMTGPGFGVYVMLTCLNHVNPFLRSLYMIHQAQSTS